MTTIMKELTIEQKAQRYDKAIEATRKLVDAGLVYEDAAIQIFPEFKKSNESEDEEIRKEMLQIAKESEDSFYMVMTPNKRERLIAWLEKQDEKPKKVSIWKHWKKGIAGNGDGKLIYLVKDGDNYSFSSCLGFECDYIELSELDKLLSEKQGEQNPVISEDALREGIAHFGITQYQIDNWLKKYVDVEKQVEQKCFPYALEKDNPARESINWLKSLKDRVQPQTTWKPTEE